MFMDACVRNGFPAKAFKLSSGRVVVERHADHDTLYVTFVPKSWDTEVFTVECSTEEEARAVIIAFARLQ